MEPNKIKDEEDHSDPGVQKICNFLRAPVAAKNEANQMILLMNHIEYLEIAVKKEFGELSDAILQKPLPSNKAPEKEPGMSSDHSESDNEETNDKPPDKDEPGQNEPTTSRTSYAGVRNKRVLNPASSVQ